MVFFNMGNEDSSILLDLAFILVRLWGKDPYLWPTPNTEKFQPCSDIYSFKNTNNSFDTASRGAILVLAVIYMYSSLARHIRQADCKCEYPLKIEGKQNVPKYKCRYDTLFF